MGANGANGNLQHSITFELLNQISKILMFWNLPVVSVLLLLLLLLFFNTFKSFLQTLSKMVSKKLITKYGFQRNTKK